MIMWSHVGNALANTVLLIIYANFFGRQSLKKYFDKVDEEVVVGAAVRILVGSADMGLVATRFESARRCF